MTASDERVLAAHRALRDGGDVQFAMMPPPPPPKAPEWLRSLGEWIVDALRPVGRFLMWIGSLMPDAPYARVFLWSLGALLLCLLLWIVQDRIRHGVWRMPRLARRRFAPPRTAEPDDAEDWRPDHMATRAWLTEADSLAAQGRYAQAVHCLLLRSVEDLSRRRPHLIQPALTSRDLSRADSIPAAPRRLFADIAAVVERSLFGRADVDAGQWAACRAAYADFVDLRSWRG